MANHVYFNIHIDATSSAVDKLRDSLKTESVEITTTWAGEKLDPPYHSYKQLAELELQPFMASANPTFDEKGYLENSWDWYCSNVGAKWCNIEDWDGDYFNGYSAWCAPIEMVEYLVTFIGQWDEDVTAYMTYEDEFRNFIGICDFGLNSEGIAYSSADELDSDEIHHHVKEKFGNLVEKSTFWDEVHEIEGEEVCPNEWMDDFIYSFFENRGMV